MSLYNVWMSICHLVSVHMKTSIMTSPIGLWTARYEGNFGIAILDYGHVASLATIEHTWPCLECWGLLRGVSEPCQSQGSPALKKTLLYALVDYMNVTLFWRILETRDWDIYIWIVYNKLGRRRVIWSDFEPISNSQGFGNVVRGNPHGISKIQTS